MKIDDPNSNDDEEINEEIKKIDTQIYNVKSDISPSSQYNTDWEKSYKSYTKKDWKNGIVNYYGKELYRKVLPADEKKELKYSKYREGKMTLTGGITKKMVSATVGFSISHSEKYEESDLLKCPYKWDGKKVKNCIHKRYASAWKKKYGKNIDFVEK